MSVLCFFARRLRNLGARGPAASWVVPALRAPRSRTWLTRRPLSSSPASRFPRDALNDGVLRYEHVRLIGQDGKNRGVVAAMEALAAARSEGADLIEAKADAKPPVWRITPRETPRAQASASPKGSGPATIAGKGAITSAKDAPGKGASFKEIRLKLGVAEHDLLTKIRQLGSFLEKEQRVRVTFRPAMRAKEAGDANTLIARIAAELQHLKFTRKVTRKDASGKPLEVDLIPTASAKSGTATARSASSTATS